MTRLEKLETVLLHLGSVYEDSYDPNEMDELQICIEFIRSEILEEEMKEEIEDDGFITVHPPIRASVSYDRRHGGPYDRGGADSYYGRNPKPHYYVGGTGSSEKIPECDMTPYEIKSYMAGYNDNEVEGNKKYL